MKKSSTPSYTQQLLSPLSLSSSIAGDYTEVYSVGKNIQVSMSSVHFVKFNSVHAQWSSRSHSLMQVVWAWFMGFNNKTPVDP